MVDREDAGMDNGEEVVNNEVINNDEVNNEELNKDETFQYPTIICHHRLPASLAVALVLQLLCRKAGEDSFHSI